MAKTHYMHTINDEPAYYVAGEQVVIASRGQTVRLVPTLQQLHAEQDASRRWRQAQGYRVDASAYGYITVEVDTDERGRR